MREIKEEVGADIEVKEEIGVIIEYRNKFKKLQISYCYLGQAVGEIGEPTYEQGEIEEGMKPMWLPIDQAIALLENDASEKYVGKFIIKRDLKFLQEAKKLLK